MRLILRFAEISAPRNYYDGSGIYPVGPERNQGSYKNPDASMRRIEYQKELRRFALKDNPETILNPAGLKQITIG